MIIESPMTDAQDDTIMFDLGINSDPLSMCHLMMISNLEDAATIAVLAFHQSSAYYFIRVDFLGIVVHGRLNR